MRKKKQMRIEVEEKGEYCRKRVFHASSLSFDLVSLSLTSAKNVSWNFKDAPKDESSPYNLQVKRNPMNSDCSMPKGARKIKKTSKKHRRNLGNCMKMQFVQGKMQILL